MKHTASNGRRHKPRGWSDAERRLDARLRGAVREQIRLWLPGHPRPPGAGWLIAAAPEPCFVCEGVLLIVKVPGVDLDGLGYCPGCGQAGLFSEAVTKPQ